MTSIFLCGFKKVLELTPLNRQVSLAALGQLCMCIKQLNHDIRLNFLTTLSVFITNGITFSYFLTAQQGLGGCLYILWCCVSDTDVENPPIQWLNGHLLTMKELLEQFSERFTTHEADGEDFATIANDILLPIIVFAVQTLSRPALPPRTTKYSKRVILYCAK